MIRQVCISKYLYTHADPVNNVDPSGNMRLASFFTMKMLTRIITWTILIGTSVGIAVHTLIKRGRTLYLDFSGFDVSNVKLFDSIAPSNEIVKNKVIEIVSNTFGGVDIGVVNGKKFMKPTIKYSPNSNADANGGIWYGGSNILTRTGRVYLGNFSLPSFNGKFVNNDELAGAIAYASMHEAGHLFLLPDNHGPGNIMSWPVPPGIKSTITLQINGLLAPRTFTQGEAEHLKKFNK
ncbi:MAG: hypothetical protein GY754_33105 [bacterium]|nr:hypothetical protein [bacterium]